MIADHKRQSDILKALAHPVRLRMVEGLARNECNVNKIVGVLKLPQSTVSQHLAILKRQGVVQLRKDGVKTCYRVVDRRIIDIVDLLGKA